MLILLDLIMEQKQCGQCGHQNSCQNIYQQICASKEPSILLKTVLALLLPLVIFIVTAAACEKLLVNLTANQSIRAILSVLSGLITVFVYIVIIKIWRFEDKN